MRPTRLTASELSAIPDAELRAELNRRETKRREAEAQEFRDTMHAKYGRCARCGSDFVAWAMKEESPILLCGLFGHEPGNYGFEARMVVTCENGHEEWHPHVTFYDHPLPL